jgi:hypothetical protein
MFTELIYDAVICREYLVWRLGERVNAWNCRKDFELELVNFFLKMRKCFINI